MPRTMQVPADLDAAGQQLWTTFVAFRPCEDEARSRRPNLYLLGSVIQLWSCRRQSGD